MEMWELVKLVSERYGRRLQEHKAGRPAAREFESLSVQQFQYLQALGSLPEPTVGSLARYFKVTSPTATSLVSRLIQAGYLKRVSHPYDRRSSYLKLTPRGRRILNVQIEAFRALARDITELLSPRELSEYVKLTRRVCDGLKDATDA